MIKKFDEFNLNEGLNLKDTIESLEKRMGETDDNEYLKSWKLKEVLKKLEIDSEYFDKIPDLLKDKDFGHIADCCAFIAEDVLHLILSVGERFDEKSFDDKYDLYGENIFPERLSLLKIKNDLIPIMEYFLKEMKKKVEKLTE